MARKQYYWGEYKTFEQAIAAGKRISQMKGVTFTIRTFHRGIYKPRKVYRVFIRR